jgi:small subunit ribosomal protein S8
MSFNDPIAELLTILRNASKAEKKFVDLRISKMKINIIQILKDQGFVENFLVNDKKHMVRIFLRYTKARDSMIKKIRRVSSPGMRKYVGYQDIPRILGGVGTVILSTSKGVIDGKKAKELKIGGEILCYVY